eukprot:g8584.t1
MPSKTYSPSSVPLSAGGPAPPPPRYAVQLHLWEKRDDFDDQETTDLLSCVQPPAQAEHARNKTLSLDNEFWIRRVFQYLLLSSLLIVQVSLMRQANLNKTVRMRFSL